MDFEWIGDPIPVDLEERQLTLKPKTFYKYDTVFKIFYDLTSY